MTLYLTRGVGGEILETLGEAKSRSQAWKLICNFKDESRDWLKVESYDRILKLGEGKLAVDFGDYLKFILVEANHESKRDVAEVEAFWNPTSGNAKRRPKLKKK